MAEPKLKRQKQAILTDLFPSGDTCRPHSESEGEDDGVGAFKVDDSDLSTKDEGSPTLATAASSDHELDLEPQPFMISQQECQTSQQAQFSLDLAINSLDILQRWDQAGKHRIYLAFNNKE